jgi:hypothetical protein
MQPFGLANTRISIDYAHNYALIIGSCMRTNGSGSKCVLKHEIIVIGKLGIKSGRVGIEFQT